MGRYNDPAIRERARQLGGRVMLAVREAKRSEAIERQARTLHDHTRAHRLGRCACWLPERAQSSPRRQIERACPWPEKDTYSTGQAAGFILGKLARFRRGGGLRPYRCPAGGHFHLGRPQPVPLTRKRAA